MSHATPPFETITGRSPYPWQQRCYDQLAQGVVPPELTLPTGAGKTSVVLLYLIALAQGAPLPRRLAYVVDRRAIVDQTTAELQAWIEAFADIPELRNALGALAAFERPGAAPVEVGTLRGGLLDTGEWRLDPAKPAVLVGTVDMVGSRLLFSGYGDGRSRRSLHAGLLGVDTTVLLDESHLSPAFAETLRQAEDLHAETVGARFRTLTMSATPRESQGAALESTDEAHPVLGARLQAAKYPTLYEVEGTAQWREQMLECALAHEKGTVLVFSRSAREAQRLYGDLVKALGEGGEERVGLLTGTLRGAEREQLTQRPLWRCFRDPQASRDFDGPVYLVATAAAEVGVDLDAEHMVMDLVPMDSLIQRLGRLNRSGRRSHSSVAIVYTGADTTYKADKDDWKNRFAAACARTLEQLQGLQRLAPQDLLGLPVDVIRDASSPAPGLVPLEADRVELLAATSAGMALPPVEPYLRGITDEQDAAEVQLFWRSDLERLMERGLSACEDALAMLPPRPRELLKVPAYAAAGDLAQIAKRVGPFQCLLFGSDGATSLLEVTADSRGLQRSLEYATLVLPARVGSLSEAGFLEPKAAGKSVSDLADDDEGLRFEQHGDEPPADLPEWVAGAVQWRIALHDEDDEEAEPHWWVYARRKAGELALNAESDLTRLARRKEDLADHNHRVAEAAARIGHALGLEDWMVEALREAGTRHDDGKASSIWQRAAGNRGSKPLAKSPRGQFRPGLLGGYRHEFGSLGKAERELAVSSDLSRDLTLHLIAAHHGHGRPGFPLRRQWDPELPDGISQRLAEDAEHRYARLQRHFGAWGLAWLEALLKCADAWVSSGYADQGGPQHD
ncbi:type I-G CRISPR-associated helicase/endonuclease Cas3g [Halorhodospira halophila]|uniref:type I-G CRISPR-associated helicase/endonuclease Cas3g n=1 Tax=Halorhodospira halophila TaxID=1053 RepID=UPI0019141C98|nr:type I-U CRISPR-associated helicase/endonuclease Cas3 [Halorhodospira halophila]MBK5943805.1 type I-U CRISPR-associated helicase/endonuclease Cas3 [Halorhodospira halophila]